MDLQMSNGNSFTYGESASSLHPGGNEPWWFRVMRPIQPDR
jgi:hypothetical protein